ncbi:hypothetical protein, partial [Rossellomorea marisflavi]|uniref:hypothetical protein n=1 Tax=Rossellomorea marisflavi TaxID=189381 RepID=UPI003D2EA6FB
VQRRPPDSYGNSGQGETLEAQPKRLTARPMESGWPQRNETVSSPPHIHYKTGWRYPCFQSSHPLSYAQSEVQQRPPDSYGDSGQGESLQARRSGSPHAPWKTDNRSETEQSRLHHILNTKEDGDSLFQSAYPLSYAQSEVQRRPPDSYGNSGLGETLQARALDPNYWTPTF